MAVDLKAFKAHLNIGPDAPLDAVDSVLLPRLLTAAQARAASDLGFALTNTEEFPDGAPADVEQAILMLAAHWYENREATIVGTIIASVPLGYDDIIANRRRYTFGLCDDD